MNNISLISFRFAIVMLAVLVSATRLPAWSAPSGSSAPGGLDAAAVLKDAPAVDNGSKDGAVAKITGFRSANFGADETTVRTAIEKDFGKASIRKSESLADRTEVLTVRVPDVLQGGGMSDVAYTFGYKSKKLQQVSVIWSKGGGDTAVTSERLVANGEALKVYFQSAGYDPKTITSDAVVKGRIALVPWCRCERSCDRADAGR